MFYFKGCGKCKGDLHLESDTYGKFLKCLQCGRITEVESRRSHAVLRVAPDIAELLVERCDGAQIGKKILTVAVDQ